MPQDRYAHERGDPAVPQCGSSPVHILFDGCPLMLRWTLAAVTIAGAVWVTADMLNEGYGAGPPYYGRTVNMDKWTSPLVRAGRHRWLATVDCGYVGPGGGRQKTLNFASIAKAERSALRR